MSEDSKSILANVYLRSGTLGEVILKECPECFAIVLEDRLDDHLKVHE
jgi:hypothetical protein